MSKDLLFELGTEELPSGLVWPLADELAKNMLAQLEALQIGYGNVQCFATPRRLAVLIHKVSEQQPTQHISRKGPAYQASMDAEGQPTKALLGFAKSCGVAVSALKLVENDKGSWWFYEASQAGETSVSLLPDLLLKSVNALSIPKLMRWGQGEIEFTRPVHWAVLLFGSESIEATLLGVATGRISRGHRFHHPEPVFIDAPDTYVNALAAVKVQADFAARQQTIIEQVNAIAAKNQATAVMPEALLDEVTSIVEWPQALLCRFDASFLEVPAQALIASMQAHQKCFALEDETRQLMPAFITVSNIESVSPQAVISGNEKVMRARLSDAAFFYNQDRKRPLRDAIPETKNVVFQEKLGSLYDKSNRIKSLMGHLQSPLLLSASEIERSADLCKCDLMTGMVGEFPELQGVMGYYYACHDDEAASVAIALNEQYMPRVSGDDLPQTQLGLALSLADRVDTLVGIFAIGQKPTGVKDPFKLRRHALAVIRMLLSTSAKMSLSHLVDCALSSYEQGLSVSSVVAGEVKSFILERLQAFYHAQGISSDLLHAALAVQDDWLYDLNQRIYALKAFIALPEAQSLSAACKRVNNILQKNSGSALSAHTLNSVNPDLLMEEAEKKLFAVLNETEARLEEDYFQGHYSNILNALAEMRVPVDMFFDEVMVMVEDAAVRANRIALLGSLSCLLKGVADISILQP